MSVLLCVDMSNQVYKAAAAHPMLTSRRIFTGGLYGFFVGFAKVVRETKATHVAFCLDTKPYKRSEAYPDYKLLRKQHRDEDLLKMYKQSMSLVLEVMEACGLIPWGLPGFEADDLGAHCVMKYRHRFDRIYIQSNDSDLFQLLWCHNLYLYRGKGIADVVHGAALNDPFGRPITPEQYMLATALMGTHNDIAGIPSVGATRAFAALHDPALMRKYRDGHAALIERNLSLIKLPHAEFPRSAALPEHRSFNPRTLYKALGRYDIETTGSMERAFQELFGA